MNDHPMSSKFPRDVILTIGSAGVVVPLTKTEQFLAFDQNQTLWAFEVAPRWSAASQKWIPEDRDTPRHIFIWQGAQVNAKDSIVHHPIY